jgi:hypothetical protein
MKNKQMKKTSLIHIFAILILSAVNSNAQELMKYQQPKDYEMPKRLIPTPRKYWVSLPKSYDETTNRYPILFVFDGDEVFLRNLVLNTVDELTNFGEIPPCIIVGIIQRNRTLDFGPLYAVKDNPSSSKVNGDKFFDFLKQELVPELNKNYRTQNFKLGIGHSLGGLFLTYCFTKDPTFFNGIIAISPALELKRDSSLFADLKRTLGGKINTHTYYCWASGTEGVNEVAFKPGSIALHKIFDTMPNPSFTYDYIDLPGKNHNLTPLFSMSNAMYFIFKDWNIATWYKGLFYDKKVDPIAYLNERIKQNKKLYGFNTDPTEDRLQNNMGLTLADHERYKEALPYSERAVQLAPGHAWYYNDLGGVQEKLKRYTDAIHSYKTAIEKLDKTAEDYNDDLENYQKNIKRVEELIRKPD